MYLGLSSCFAAVYGSIHRTLQELLYDKQKLLDNGDRCSLRPMCTAI
jgi:hypothetical protein